jgi:hypothetical protein
MLAALACQEMDYPPCSFMLFNALRETSRDYLDFIERQLEMGLDAFVQIPPRPPVVFNDWYNLHGLPVNFDPAVQVREWVEYRPAERWPVLMKEYLTPAGKLSVEVFKDETWRWGDHVPLFDDYLESRSRAFLVKGESDLAAMRYLLVPPTATEVGQFRAEAQPCIDLAQRRGLLLAGGWGVGADMLGWIYGLQNMIYTAADAPGFLEEMLNLIADWNRRRMEVVLQAGVELYIKRAWYENCDFFSPRLYRRFILPILKDDVALAHSFGARFGYLITANCMPLLELFAEAKVDVLIGVDPARWNLAESKRRLNGKVCLWGGVNGHLTVEMGSEEQVRNEVGYALDTLAPGGGLILSPVDNVRHFNQVARRNVEILIDEWQKRRSL